MADLVFAHHTNSILNMLPYWFQARKFSGESIGARFLNISGLELDDARYVIDYAYNQCYANTIDMDQVDCCYKAIVPMPFRVAEIKNVFVSSAGLIKADSVKEFFGIDQHGIRDKNLRSFEYYYADDKRNVIYVRQRFNADATSDNGKISVVFKDGTEREYKLVPHQVWNFFDEMGNLLSCPRLPMEPNVEYKVRIMDVFINPANASKHGLINGIGRELATRKVVRWEDPTKDFEIEDPMVVLNSITLDKNLVPLDRVFISGAGTVIVKGDPKSDHKNCFLSYVWGLEMHQLYNKDDIKLYNELFTVEWKAKKRLKKYIDILNSESPIFWDHFHWNEHYWDQNAADVSGVGFIPHLYNGSIRGFKQYGVVEPLSAPTPPTKVEEVV